MARASGTASAHTPSPWVFRDNGKIQAQAQAGTWGDYICSMPFSSLKEAEEISPEQIPNARLVAAAPELRTASQKLYDAINRHLTGIESGDIPAELEEAMDEIEAAWHKADGTVSEEDDGSTT